MRTDPLAARPRQRPFRLMRFYSIASLIGIVVVSISLIWTDRNHERGSLIEHEGGSNADLTRVFANAVWDRYRDFVLQSAGRTRDDLLADPTLQQLNADVKAKMRGLRVVKVKIYSLDGLTVYSTDERQIGEDKSANQGFRDAAAGKVNSQITYREQFDAFEGSINNRNLIASYVPIVSASGGSPEGVFEIYTDVTELLDRQSHDQWEVSATVLVTLVLLYLFLFLAVRKASNIIEQQELERAAQEQDVRHQAYHDALTGLPNRAYFTERMAETILSAARRQASCALMFIDLDRFKIVNDSLGHQSGDELLQVVSRRIHGCLRGSDTLFRMGGDEFTIILPDVESPEDAAGVAQRVLDSVAQPISINEHELTVGATIGVAIYPDDGDNAQTLLKSADAAMYSAKESGRGMHAFYRESMNKRALHRLNLESALQKGFRDGEFTLYYQPRLDAGTRRVLAVEALIRWESPSRGLVLPGDFISVLEDTGMMPIVGEWVLRTACTQVCRWQQANMPPLRVSVNVSSVQFQSRTFVPMVERVLHQTGAPASLIELELTESLLITNAEQASATIAELKALGLCISIDDFGTGYSSLNYLRNFSVDFLKIDRSFVSGVATHPRDHAVAAAIIELARALKMSVVAEGVETETQAAMLTSAGCDELQGYLFSRPLPVAEIESYLTATNSPGRTGAKPRRASFFGPLLDAMRGGGATENAPDPADPPGKGSAPTEIK